VKSSKKQSGFSVVELLMVVAIILVITAIVVPNYLSAKMRANESVTVANVRALVSAQALYLHMFPEVGYSPDVKSLGGNANPPLATSAGLLGEDYSKPTNGYVLTITPRAEGAVNIGYNIVGTPTKPGITGKRGFCANETGAISYSDDGSSNCTTAIPW
jgi:prepilin-type N-terminal cleavage/methylation domain-containing protein